MLSEHFSLDAIVASGCAKELGVNNYPCEAAKNQLTKLCNNIMEKIWIKAKNELGLELVVNSTYRSPVVNSALGDAKYANTKPSCYNKGRKASANSQHMRGEALDISFQDKSRNKDLYNLIDKMINNKEITVGQLINEYGYQWVHVSLGTKNERLTITNKSKG